MTVVGRHANPARFTEIHVEISRDSHGKYDAFACLDMQYGLDAKAFDILDYGVEFGIAVPVQAQVFWTYTEDYRIVLLGSVTVIR